jgi:hypothetical protein
MFNTLFIRAGSLLACMGLAFSCHAKAISIDTPLTVTALTHTLSKVAPKADPKVIELALNAMQCATYGGMSPSQHLTVIDYSKASSEPRLWVFDLKSSKLLFEELVAHGKNTGEKYATNFSNTNGSLQTSLGLFVTKSTYHGANGYSLKMEGLEKGFNDKAMERAIVFHGAPYVSDSWVKQHGRIGRSWGCPAVNRGVAKKVIDTIKGEQFLFSYYPDEKWLSSSEFLNCNRRNANKKIQIVSN